MLTYASAVDMRQRIISNKLCGAIVLLGMGSNSLLSSGSGLFASMGGLSVGFFVMLLLHRLTGLGAGDVKLMGAIGSIVGSNSILIIIYYTFLSSGLFAVAFLIYYGGWGDIYRRHREFWGGFCAGRLHYREPVPGSPAAFQMPMAPAITLASVYHLLPSLVAAFPNSITFFGAKVWAT